MVPAPTVLPPSRIAKRNPFSMAIGVISFTVIVRFVGDLKVEMKKVTWPGKNEVYGTTVVVLVTVVIFGVYLFLVDFSLQVAINQLFSLFL